MTRSRKIAGVVLSLSVWGGAVSGFAGDGVAFVLGEPVGASLVPVDAALPYNGYGTVAILDDGMLIITRGGETRRDATTNELIFETTETIAYQMDVSGLALVQNRDAEVFLDRNGTEIARRGLRPDQVTQTSFRRADDSELASNRYALLSLTGDLHLELDEFGSGLTLAITDEDTGRAFSFTGRIKPDGVTENRKGTPGSLDASAMAKPDNRIGLSVPPQSFKSNCEVACIHGSCDISCDTIGCTAYCHGGKPVCLCLNKVP